MTSRDIARMNEKKVLKAIKKLPKQDEYFVGSLSEVAILAGVPQGSITAAIRRLEKKEIIEVRQSVALFGTMQKRGIKVLGE